MRIYLDNCCFNRPFDDQSQVRVLLETEAKLVVQDRIRSGYIQLVCGINPIDYNFTDDD